MDDLAIIGRPRSPVRPKTHLALLILCVGWFAILVPTRGAHAAHPRPLSYLGGLTSDIPERGSGLFWFMRIGPAQHQRGRVSMVVFETAWDEGSAVDRWAYVKVLDQFGTWSGLREAAITVHDQCNVPCPPRPAPTPDWSRARYRSRYVTLLDRVMQTKPSSPLRRLPAADERLFEQAAHVQLVSYDLGASSQWPVVAVGGYGTHGGFDTPGHVDWDDIVGRPRTFGDLQSAFRAGQRSSQGYVNQFNAYVNVIVALICHADGNRPGGVCGHWAIRQIEKMLH